MQHANHTEASRDLNRHWTWYLTKICDVTWVYIHANFNWHLEHLVGVNRPFQVLAEHFSGCPAIIWFHGYLFVEADQTAHPSSWFRGGVASGGRKCWRLGAPQRSLTLPPFLSATWLQIMKKENKNFSVESHPSSFNHTMTLGPYCCAWLLFSNQSWLIRGTIFVPVLLLNHSLCLFSFLYWIAAVKTQTWHIVTS